MSNPLEIMNEIDTGFLALTPERGWMVAVTEKDWQFLRTAIEKQSNWLMFVEQKHEECADNLVKAQERIAWLEAQAEELAQAKARIARLEEEANTALIALFNSFDPKSRNASEARNAIERLSVALKASLAQSLAAIKASALREAADNSRDPMISTSHLHWIADRIEREAKEES